LYENGRLRYQGAFKNGNYYGENSKVYHSHLDIYKPASNNIKNLLLQGTFDNNGLLQGQLTDGPDSRIFMIDPSYDGLAWWAFYKDGKFDTSSIEEDGRINKHIMLNDPGIDCFYEGEYVEGKKHGQYGKIECRVPSNLVVFEGEWRNNLPYRNSNDAGEEDRRNVVFYSRFNKGKIFEGSVMRCGDEGLCGYATIYDSKTGIAVYEGRYKAPCLSAVMFVTFDLEMENLKDFVPKFTM